MEVNFFKNENKNKNKKIKAQTKKLVQIENSLFHEAQVKPNNSNIPRFYIQMCFKCNVFKTNYNFTDCFKNVTQGFIVFLEI